jgi:hypothetical protein
LAKGHEKVAERAPETELEKAWNGGKKWAEPSKMMDFVRKDGDEWHFSRIFLGIYGRIEWDYNGEIMIC